LVRHQTFDEATCYGDVPLTKVLLVVHVVPVVSVDEVDDDHEDDCGDE
jgi:hypothetical protein